VIFAFNAGMAQTDLRPQLRALTQPTLLMRGDGLDKRATEAGTKGGARDLLGPEAGSGESGTEAGLLGEAQSLANYVKAIPGQTQVEVIPGGGNVLPWENVRECAAAIRSFVVQAP
jgi:pimeloyl-ACP methyl ester carboxylesterase